MKIAFIPSTFLPDIGGAEIQTHNFANQITDKGHLVEVMLLNKLSLKNAKYKIFRLNKYLISIVFLLKYYLNLNFTVLLRFYFKKIIESKKYDLWHFHSVNYKTLIYIQELKKLNQKIIVTLQGADIQIDNEINYGYRLDKKYDKYIKQVFQNVDYFQAISTDIFNELLKFGIKQNKISIIPNCTPLRKLSYLKKKSDKHLTLLTIGRYAKKISEFKWIIIGRNSNKLREKEFIKKNNDNFEIINQIENLDETYFPHSELIKYYKKSDVYVNLSRIEGSPIVLIDAIASYIPIITFNTKGGDEIVLDGINGQIVNTFDFKDFAKKITISKDLKIDINNNQIRNHVNKFDLKLNTEKIINIYNLINKI